MTQLDLTSLSKKQLNTLLWELKGTPAVYPVYNELRTRLAEVTIKISDPDWERKTDDALRQALGIAQQSDQKAF